MPNNIIYLPPAAITVKPSDLHKTGDAVQDNNVVSPDRLANRLDKRKREDGSASDTDVSPAPPRKRERRISRGDAPPPTPFPALVTMAQQHADVETMRTLGDQLTRLRPFLSDMQRVQLWSHYANSYLRGYVRRDDAVVKLLADAMANGLHTALPPEHVDVYQKALLQVFEATGGEQVPSAFDIAAYARRISEHDALSFLNLMPLYFSSAKASMIAGLIRILDGFDEHPIPAVTYRATEMRSNLRKCILTQHAYDKLGGITLENLEISTARLFNVHVNGLETGEPIVTLQANMQEVYTALSTVTRHNKPLQQSVESASLHLIRAFLVTNRTDAATYLDLTREGQGNKVYDLWDEQGNFSTKYDINYVPFHLELSGEDGSHAVGMRISTNAPEGVSITVFNTGFGTHMYHQTSAMRLKSETSLPDFNAWKRPQTGGNCTTKSYRMLEAYAVGAKNYFKIQQGRRYMVALELERKLLDNPGGSDEFPKRELLRLVREKLARRFLPSKDIVVSYVNSQYRVEGIPHTQLKTMVNRLLAITEKAATTLQAATALFYGSLGAQTDVAELAQMGGLQNDEAGMVANALIANGYAMELGPPTARKLHVTKLFVESARQNREATINRLDQELLFSVFSVYDGVLDDITAHLLAQANKFGYLAVAPYPTYRSANPQPPATPKPTRASSPAPEPKP